MSVQEIQIYGCTIQQKLILFRLWNRAVRVEIITTPDNIRSQRAIERLGAIREGIFRKKYNQRDYIIYSMIDDEWKDVKERLEGFLRGDRYINAAGGRFHE